MSEIPFLPHYCNDYLAETVFLTNEQQGIYMRLMSIIWSHDCQPVPDDDRVLARVFSITTHRWRTKIRPVLERFFDVSGGTWRHPKLEKLWAATQKRMDSSRRNGSKGGRPRAPQLDLIEELAAFGPEEKPAGSDPDNLEATQGQTIQTQTQTQTQTSPPDGPPAGDPADDGFAAFWAAMPDRGQHANPEKPAHQAWLAALAKGADPAAIVAGARAYAAVARAAGKAGSQMVMQAKTFLMQEAWRQYARQPAGAAPGGPAADQPVRAKVSAGVDPARWQAALEQALRLDPQLTRAWLVQLEFTGTAFVGSDFVVSRVRNDLTLQNLLETCGFGGIEVIPRPKGGATVAGPPAAAGQPTKGAGAAPDPQGTLVMGISGGQAPGGAAGAGGDLDGDSGPPQANDVAA